MASIFKDKRTQAFNRGDRVPELDQIANVVARKLDMVVAAAQLTDLKIPPNNRLEKLKGNRRNQWSIRINDQWRICFVWTEDGARQIEIVDYH